MPDESSGAAVEKLLADEKALEDRRQALIADLLKQKETAIKNFDEELAKLNYDVNSGKHKRSHHRKAGLTPAEPPAKQKVKA